MSISNLILFLILLGACSNALLSEEARKGSYFVTIYFDSFVIFYLVFLYFTWCFCQRGPGS